MVYSSIDQHVGRRWQSTTSGLAHAKNDLQEEAPSFSCDHKYCPHAQPTASIMHATASLQAALLQPKAKHTCTHTNSVWCAPSPQDKYLAGRAARVRRVLSEAGVVADAMSLAASGTPVSLPSRTVVEAAESWGFTQQGPPALKTFIKVGTARMPKHCLDSLCKHACMLLLATCNCFSEHFGYFGCAAACRCGSHVLWMHTRATVVAC